MKDDDIPTLTDLIEEGDDDEEIRFSDLGLDADDPIVRDVEIELDDDDLEAAGSSTGDSALEQTVRRIFDRHMERAWQEIRLAIRNELNKS